MALIYIVEDDKNIREIEYFSIKNGGYEVEAFGDAAKFYTAIKEKKPDLVLLDIMLPDEDGLEVLQKLKDQPDTKEIPVILVTAKATEIDQVQGLDQGADDYLTKPFGVMELVARVKALLRRCRQKEEDDRVFAKDIILFPQKRMVQVGEKEVELTYKEYELLHLLMISKGQVVAREHILEKVWDTDFEGESRTLDMHIKTLRKKLGESGNYIKTVRNVGYFIE